MKSFKIELFFHHYSYLKDLIIKEDIIKIILKKLNINAIKFDYSFYKLAYYYNNTKFFYYFNKIFDYDFMKNLIIAQITEEDLDFFFEILKNVKINKIFINNIFNINNNCIKLFNEKYLKSEIYKKFNFENINFNKNCLSTCKIFLDLKFFQIILNYQFYTFQYYDINLIFSK
jgi:hypothetical protein